MDLGTVLRLAAARNPHKAAVVCGDDVVTFAELDRSTDALARWLLRQGLESGDRVALHWSNSVEVVNLYYACFKAGMIAVPLNNRLKAPEIAYILQHSGAKLCFSQAELAPLAAEAREECPGVLAHYTALPEVEAGDEVLEEISPERVAAILYTSGTTARPKGVMHTHVSLTGATQLMISLGLDENHTLLSVTQMVHISALACVVLPGITCGATVVMLRAFEAGAALDAIERWGCSYFLALPAMLRFVVEEQARKPRKVDSVRICFAGGDSVPPTLQEQFRLLFGAAVQELFGMTETVPVTCIP